MTARHVAFLHTAPVHVETFERLVKAADPTLHTTHLVMEALLAEAQAVGAADPALVARVQQAMVQAAEGGADIVVCTCSTVGGAAERTPTGGRFKASRIDRAMADRAVALGPRILLVAALDSTLGPSTTLLHESAAARGTSVEITPLVIADAWACYQRGDQAAYVLAVGDAVRARAGGADVVVLAQASMAPAAVVLRDLGIEVLSSPVLGVENLLIGLR